MCANGKGIKTKTIPNSFSKSMKDQCRIYARQNDAKNLKKSIKMEIQSGPQNHKSYLKEAMWKICTFMHGNSCSIIKVSGGGRTGRLNPITGRQKGLPPPGGRLSQPFTPVESGGLETIETMIITMLENNIVGLLKMTGQWCLGIANVCFDRLSL